MNRIEQNRMGQNGMEYNREFYSVSHIIKLLLFWLDVKIFVTWPCYKIYFLLWVKVKKKKNA